MEIQDITTELQKIWPQIVSRSWIDSDFKKQLLDNPSQILERHGIKNSLQKTFEILENTSNKIYLVIPCNPEEEFNEVQLTTESTTTDEMKHLWTQIIAKAKADSALKKQLLTHPNQLLEQHGIKTCANTTFKITENTNEKTHLVLPHLILHKRLHNCGKLQLRPSSLGGYGVFATDHIKKGEVLEEVPFILFNRPAGLESILDDVFLSSNQTGLVKSLHETLQLSGFLSDKKSFTKTIRETLGHRSPEMYYFSWFPPAPMHGEEVRFMVMPLGFGPMYNSRNCDHNASWIRTPRTFIFMSEKDIEKDSEIYLFYGYFLAENGSVFGCDDVFNLAIDSYEGESKIKAIRFKDAKQLDASQSTQLTPILSIAKDGASITRISGLSLEGLEINTYDFHLNDPISLIYQKLFDFRQSPLPIIKITLRFTHKNTGREMTEEIVFEKKSG